MLLPADTALPALGQAGFSLLSLNVMLPNSFDGWWLYKMYPPSVMEEAHPWRARRALLKEQLLTADADVVCLQETCAASFESDFDFLFEAGYAASISSKGRMRPATLWKTSRFMLCSADGTPATVSSEAEGEEPSGFKKTILPSHSAAVIQGDRTLTTVLKLLTDEGSAAAGSAAAGAPVLYVTNCHLAAGAEARRRLRQVHDSMEMIRKLRAKTLPKDSEELELPIASVVCGDFNSQGESAVRKLLLSGEVLPTFRESGDPTEFEQESTEVTPPPLTTPHHPAPPRDTPRLPPRYHPPPPPTAPPKSFFPRTLQDDARAPAAQVTSKAKRQSLARFKDAYALVSEACGDRQPTMFCPQLQPLMQNGAGEPSEPLLAALREAFAKLSASGTSLTRDEQREWLVAINRKEGRGSEHRAAEAAREARGGDDLTLDDFVAVYTSELSQGKFWGVEHDLRLLLGKGLHQKGAPPFTAIFDYLYFSGERLEASAVLNPLRPEQADALARGDTWLPNEWAASDHLPVAAALRFVRGEESE